MLKHVSYRSSSSLGRPSDFASCRSTNILSPSAESIKENPLNNSTATFSTSSPLKCRNLSNLSICKGTSDVKEDLLDLGFEDMSLPYFRTPDTISLASAMSFSSLAHGKYNTMEPRQFSSLQHHGKSLSLNKYASRCSSTISLNDSSGNKIPVKVYLNRLRSDMEYKILSLSTNTTCRDLILYLLAKFRLRHRDPNLFYVDMEVTVDSPSEGHHPVKRHLVLNDNDRPAELLQCRPKGNAHFSIGLRGGGVVRVHDSALSEGSQYKSLLISHRTTADELVQLLLNCYNKLDNPGHFTLYETCTNPYKNRLINPDEIPILIQSVWPKDSTRNSYAFVIRHNSSYSLSLKSKPKWRRSLDQSSTDNESEIEDHHNTTRASIMSTTSTGSNSSCSSGISSDASSTCSSSSGVSSGESFSSSPSPSPIKRIISQKCSSMVPTPNISSLQSSSSKTSPSTPKAIEPKMNIERSPPLSTGSNRKPIAVTRAEQNIEEAKFTPGTLRPPRPTPRTLFPPRIIDALCIKKTTPLNVTNEKTPSRQVPSTENAEKAIRVVEPKLEIKLAQDKVIPKLSRSFSTPGLQISRQLSTANNNDSGVEDIESDQNPPPALPPRSSRRFSAKKANIRSLSKSTVNLSLLSPISSKSKSYHNLSFTTADNFVTSSTPKTSSGALFMSRRFANEGHNPLKTKSLSLSTNQTVNAVLNSSNCCLNCENCFYI